MDFRVLPYDRYDASKSLESVTAKRKFIVGGYYNLYENNDEWTFRKTIDLLKKQGYKIDDPWDVVEAFEDKVAKFAGSKYAVATDSCTNSMFLCLKN